MQGRFGLKRAMLLLLIAAPKLLPAQANVRNTRLTVKGQAGEAAVVQAGGRNYVDVESLARITGGTLAFQGGQIVLTLPGLTAAAQSSAPAATTATTTAARPVLSREFVTATVGAVSAMREWRVALVSAIQQNQEVTDGLMSPYRRQAEAQVALAAAAARTEPDRSATALVQGELSNLRTLSGNYISVHDTVTNIRTDALDTDALSAKVLTCLQGLAGMQAGGQFQDVTTCH